MGCQILLVEDNRLVTDALVVLLEAGGGHTVRTAATVADAIARGAEAPVDVLLLDLTLPDGDGIGVLAGLRAAAAEPAVAVALTGHDDPATIARCTAAGCRAVLLKPVPARELLARVAEWEEEARATR